MNRPLTIRTAAATALIWAGTAGAADYTVPSVATPTLDVAIAAAAASLGVNDVIWITSSPIIVGGVLTLDNRFGPTNQLVIRPGLGLTRATIASNNGAARIFWLDGAGYVTLQDLDIVRAASNQEDLVVINYKDGHYPDHDIIQRCRIGSIWGSAGVANKACLRITQPVDVVVRNCIFFALVQGTFDRGIWASGFVEDINSLYLYNNDVADHKLAGIRIDDDAGAPGSFVVLRNNVVSNHPGLAAEPFAYVSVVDDFTSVITSHNTAFATAGFVEFAGGTSIAGFGGGTLYVAPRAAADAAFADVTWDIFPAWDPNPNFWRLEPLGPLHDLPGKYGQTVKTGDPHPDDIAVVDDIEGQTRPGGAPNPHTDRGADQIEPGVALAVGPGPGAEGLWAAPAANPAREVAVRFATERAGLLEFEVLDVAGRRLHRIERPAVAGESGLLAWGGAARGGVHFSRVRLTPATGPAVEARGRLVLLD